MPLQVVNGAMLMCSQGVAPSSLVVLPLDRVLSSNQPAATIMDHVPMLNIMPFGMCRSLANPTVASATTAALGVLTPMPCIPATATPWSPGESSILHNNKPALTQTCKLNCLWAGTIQITVPGQVTHIIGKGSGGGGGGGAAGAAGALAAAAGPAGAAGAAGAAGGAGAGAAVTTGLGADVDALAAKSPSLQKDLAQLQKDGWKIEYGPPGGGSTANRGTKTILIDGNEKGNPTAVTQSLAHEVGHATYPYKPDVSSKDAYVKGALADEGAATLNNIKVQREILANGGPDIGIAGNPANQAGYNAAYDQYLKDGDAKKARDAMGATFGTGEITSNTHQPYADYYGDWYDKTYGGKK
jgi:type VI secretion system secreted protein VgrG